jgi:alkanesulfonate monooxygenase SsuD/methylene tetrahydromethanopterin reductase-like flavin-dependent oxidoreductase (luciferase family)
VHDVEPLAGPIRQIGLPVRSFVDPEEARFLTPALIEATCLTGVPERIVERLRELEGQGLSQIMLYPPLNRQYRVIEDFADRVMVRL